MPSSGEPLAFHFGIREYEKVDELLSLLKPFDIKVVYADNNFAYQSRV
ncbi:MAG: IS1 family transposase, partial [Treponema sp.]|nr:IS1 family transposase [Treponema sp.]